MGKRELAKEQEHDLYLRKVALGEIPGEMTGYASKDKPWLKYYDVEKIQSTSVSDESVYQYILEENRQHFNETALIFYGQKISYRALFSTTDRIAGVLSATGISIGDNVLLCMTGTPETVELLLACSKIGACAVMLNPTLSVTELKEIINEANASVLFCMDKLYSTIAPALDTYNGKRVAVPAINSLPTIVQWVLSIKDPLPSLLKKDLADNRCQSWRMFLREASANTEPICKGGEQPLAVVFSSGTTGRPKGIVHTNRSYNALSVEYQCNGYPFKRGDRFLYNIPSFIAAGLSYTLFAPLAQGVVMILEPLYDEKQFVADIIKYKPHIVPGTKSFWYAALRDSRMSGTDLSFITIPVTGGEPVFARDEDNINDFLKCHGCKVPLYIGWGMSELNATITTSATCGNTKGSSGIPLPNVVVAAFDVDTETECKYGRYGELRVISPCAMKEYYNNREATNAFFWHDANGTCWCKSGDIGFVNENGEVFTLGRATDYFITSNKQRVYLFDIENVIMTDKDVQSCKVVAVNLQGLTVPVAHIMLVDECSLDDRIAIEKIHTLCVRALSEAQIPKLYKIRKQFPLTTTGKRDSKSLQNERDRFYQIIGGNVETYTFCE